MALPAPETGTPTPLLEATASAGRRPTQLARMRLVAEIVLAYLKTRRALRTAPIAGVVAMLRAERSPRDPPPYGEDGLLEARHLGRAVTRTLALLPGDTRCLMQALVLTRLLAARGIPGKLAIGSRTAPSFAAHAWVEHAGQPVLFAGEGLFNRLVEL
jgi:hypothetical protein